MSKSSAKITVFACLILALLVSASYLLFDKTEDRNPAAPSQSTSLKPVQPSVEKSPQQAVAASKQARLTPAEAKAPLAGKKESNWVQAAREAMKNPDLGIRVQSVADLRKQMSPEAIDLLKQFLKDEEPAVVAEAIDTLGYIGLNSQHKALVFKVLAEKAADKDFFSRGTALITAAMLGEDDQILPIIAKYIEEQEDESQDFAVRALTFIARPACVPYLAEIVKTTAEPQILRNSFNLLARIGTPDAMALLEGGVYSEDGEIQTGSVWALSRRKDEASSQILTAAMVNQTLGNDAISVIAASQSAAEIFGDVLYRDDIELKDKLNWLKILAANTINAPGSVRNEVAEMLKPLLDSPDAAVQRQAIETLGKVGSQTDQTDALVSKLESGDFLVQQAALQAFIQFCSPDTYKPLKKLWYHEDESMRRTAFFFSEPFLNLSDLEDLQKATQHQDEFIAKHSQIVINYLKQ